MNVNQDLILKAVNPHYRHATLVRYQDSLVVFGMDATRQIFYTVLDMKAAASEPIQLAASARLHNLARLDFPVALVSVTTHEHTQLPDVQTKSRTEHEPGSLSADDRDPFLSTTARLSADAPFQVVSDDSHIYLFRQSLTGNHADMVAQLKDDGTKLPAASQTLLLDRYELREATLQPISGPTQVLDFVQQLQDGRFAVLLLPTPQANRFSWQIFAHNSQAGCIEAWTVERSQESQEGKEGLVDLARSPVTAQPDEPAPVEPSEKTLTIGEDGLPTLSGETFDCAVLGEGKRAGKAYFFHGDQYVRADSATQAVDEGYPRSINPTFGFPHPFDQGMDAAVGGAGKRAGKAYFFKGTQYLRYSYRLLRVEKGYPHPINPTFGFPPPFDQGVDAAVLGAGKRAGKAYFFRGDQYIRYDFNTLRVDEGYPRPINPTFGFPAPFDQGVDAAVSGTGIYADKAYFFRGDQYIRYDFNTLKVDPGYPQPIPVVSTATQEQAQATVSSKDSSGEYPGLRHSSFQIDGRTLDSGISAMLSRQQPRRVLLAMATTGPGLDGKPSNQSFLTLLDMALPLTGTPESTPSPLSLPAVPSDNIPQLEQLRNLLQREQTLHAKMSHGFHKQDVLEAKARQPNARLGTAVGLSGEWAIVGAYEASSENIAQAGCGYVFHLENGGWVEKQQLTASMLQVGARFGAAVSMAGEWAIIGAYEASPESITQAGCAYVFHLENGSWVEKQQLTASSPQAGGRFGVAIDIAGEWAIIGADAESPGDAPQAGCAYAFHLENGSWVEKQQLVAQDQYVFHLEHDSWVEKQQLVAQDQQADDHFGLAVGLNAEWALIGADTLDTSGSRSAGSVYAFQLENGAWIEKQKLTASKTHSVDGFGSALGLNGTWALIGAYAEGQNELPYAGKVYAFQLDNGTWTERQQLTASESQANAYFGFSVSVSGDWALVGTAGHKAYGRQKAGWATLFQRLGDQWQERQHLVSSDLQANAAFGFAVAMAEDRAIVGANAAAPAGIAQAGRAYVFDSSLSAASAELAQVQREIQELKVGQDAQPLPLLHTDSAGLTLHGGVFYGVPTAETPHLFDAATGLPRWPGLLVQVESTGRFGAGQFGRGRFA